MESEIDYFKNELVNRTNQYQSENIHLKDKLIKNEEILEKDLTLIKESIREKNIEVSTEEKSKNSIKIISPKNLNEFEKNNGFDKSKYSHYLRFKKFKQ